MNTKAKVVLASVLAATTATAASVAIAPFTASFIVWEASGQETRIPFALMDYLQATDKIDFVLGYADWLVEEGYWYVFPASLLIGIALAAAFVSMVYLSTPKREIKNSPLAKQFAFKKSADLLKHSRPWNGKSMPADGIALGNTNGQELLFPCTHACVIAPSRCGKTRCCLFPTIDSLTWENEDNQRRNNLIILDPSLETLGAAKRLLQERGYTYHLLDLVNARQGSRFNVLQLPLLLAEKDPPSVETCIKEIAAILCPDNGGENSVFDGGAQGLIAATMYAVVESSEIPHQAKHLWSCVKTITAGTINGAEPLKEWLRSFGVDSPVVSLAAVFLSSEGKLEASILSTALNCLSPFSSKEMRWLTSASDTDAIDICSILFSKEALFVRALPGSPSSKIASILLAEHWLATQLFNKRGLMGRKVFVLADEFASIPRYPSFVNEIQQCAKFNISFYLFLQSTSSLTSVFGKEARDEILSNCDLLALYRANGDDAKMFEFLSGYKVVTAKSIGETSRRVIGSPSASQNYSEQRVPVWSAAEIAERNPQKDGVLVFSQASGGRNSAKLEVPIVDPSQTFVAKHFGTLGPREYEAEILKAFFAELETNASKVDLFVPAWTPDFSEYMPPESPDSPLSDEELFGL